MTEMTEERAREILGDAIQSDGSLYRIGGYIEWLTFRKSVVLDSEFTAEELKAIAFWMEKHGR